MKNRKKLRYLLSYLTDTKVSLIKKMWVLVPIVYLLLPTDLIPDFFIGPGFIDDIFVLLTFSRKVQRDLDQYIFKHSSKKEKESEIQNIQ